MKNDKHRAIQVTSPVTRHSDTSEMADRRNAIIAEQRSLATEKRFLEEQVVEKLFKEGRYDMLTVNWSKLARMG